MEEGAANAVSMTYIAGVAVPAALWLRSEGQDVWFLWLILTVLGTGVAVEWFKRGLVWIGAGAWTRRPVGARNCDLWCVGGPAGGAPGFPSGHMTAATLLVSALWFRLQEPVVLWIGVPWIVAMGWARWVKGCHSVLQIVVGAALGGGVGWLIAT